MRSKEFFHDECVQKTKLFIDWGARRIRLLPTDTDEVAVTRQLQVMALRPHVIRRDPETNSWLIVEADEEHIQRFDKSEVVIRDCYDRFLDGLETFASYAESELVDVKALTPYIGYWIHEIQDSAGSKSDAA